MTRGEREQMAIQQLSEEIGVHEGHNYAALAARPSETNQYMKLVRFAVAKAKRVIELEEEQAQ